VRAALRYLITLGFASAALQLVIAYAKAEPPTLTLTMVGVLACVVTGVWGWLET
jgi:hypothetical protein